MECVHSEDKDELGTGTTVVRGCGPFCCLEFYLYSLNEKVKAGEKAKLSSLTDLTAEEACDRPVCTKPPIMKLMSHTVPYHTGRLPN